ncbi:unnamed protein product [Cuscuta epithymum]|uniref:Uncharacterized protein n=1 Tax=Cuscuta epithymum TaxID=186058 RepID=A0AAV0F9U0_9ASTE|nr:unnamed protein product [Cuscuta epithymum]
MVLGTYVVLAGLSLGLQGRFSPEAINWLFMKGLVGWFLQVTLLKMTLFPPGSSDLWSWRWPSSIFSDNNQKSWSWNEWRERLLMRLEYNRYWTENAKHLEKCWAKVQLYF